MRVVANFNPSAFASVGPASPAGTFNAQFGSGEGKIVVYNKSPNDLLLTFSDGDTFIVHSQQADYIHKDLPKWVVQWSLINTSGLTTFFLTGNIPQPYQNITVVAYQPSEQVPLIYPVNLPITFPPTQNQFMGAGQLFITGENNTTAATAGLNVPTALYVNTSDLLIHGIIIYSILVYSTDVAPTHKLFSIVANPGYTNTVNGGAAWSGFPISGPSPVVLNWQKTTHAEPTGGALYQAEPPTRTTIDMLNGIPYHIPVGSTTNGLVVFTQTSAATAIDYGVAFIYGDYVLQP